MRLATKLLLALAVALPAGYGTAFAQSVRVEIYGGPAYGPGYYYSDPDDEVLVRQRAPRVYGYTSGVVVPDADVRIRPANCGQFHYWNGVRCADARITPPDLN